MQPNQEQKELPIEYSADIPDSVRRQFAEAHDIWCQMCGISIGEIDEYTGRKVRFLAAWIPDNGLSLRIDYPELRVLCSTCDLGAKNITTERPPAIWLLSQIRRAGIEEQKAAYEWLHRKFGAH